MDERKDIRGIERNVGVVPWTQRAGSVELATDCVNPVIRLPTALVRRVRGEDQDSFGRCHTEWNLPRKRVESFTGS